MTIFGKMYFDNSSLLLARCCADCEFLNVEGWGRSAGDGWLRNETQGGRGRPEEVGSGKWARPEAPGLSFCFTPHTFPRFALGCFQIAYGFPADY